MYTLMRRIKYNDKNRKMFFSLKSCFKDRINENKKLKNIKDTKSNLFLQKLKQANSLDNSLIRLNSQNKFLENSNFINSNAYLKTINQENYKVQKFSKKFLSQYNLNPKISSNEYFFDLLSRRNNIKESSGKSNNYDNHNLKLKLNNISNSSNYSISLFNNSQKIYTKYPDLFNIYKNNNYDLPNLNNKDNEKVSINFENKSNIYKIEYIKKLMRIYYFKNFDTLKEYYNDINYHNNSYLSTDDFVFYLKEKIKINIDAKEIKNLLNKNGIIKVDYSSFKYIFFPELANNKVISFKLKNEKNIYVNDTPFNNNLREEISSNTKDDKKLFSIENVLDPTGKIIRKIKLNNLKKNKINYSLMNIIRRIRNENKKIENLTENNNLKKSVYNNRILNAIKIYNKKDLDLFLLKSMEKNSKNNTNNINEKELNDFLKISSINKDIKDESKNKDKIFTDNDKKSKIINVFNKKKNDNNIKIFKKNNSKINSLTSSKNIIKEKYTMKRNKTIINEKNPKDSYRDLLFYYKNNHKLFFTHEKSPSNLKLFGRNDETRNKEKNSDIIEFLK